MKSLVRPKSLVSFMLASAVAISFAVASSTANAQSVTLDFRFDGQTGAAATTATLLPGAAPQDYLIDMWVTVDGDAANADSALYGLQGIHIRGFSDVASGGGAFSTGAGVGVASTAPFPVVGPFLPADVTGPGLIADSGSTTNGTAVSSTLDGIADFGARSNILNDFVLSHNGVINASQAGVSDGAGGWSFEVGQFLFRTGTASTTNGATTLFYPTRIFGSGTAANITQDGTNVIQVSAANELIGTPLTFVVNSGVTPGAATADNSNSNSTFGPPVTAPVANGGSYTGVQSMVVGLQGTGGSPAFGTDTPGGTATILAGVNSGADTNASMEWRTRITGANGGLPENVGGPGSAAPKTTTGLVSDVVNLTGLETGAGAATDPFAFQMNYNPALLPKPGNPLEATLQMNGKIFMVSLDPSSGLWENTVFENTGNDATPAMRNFLGSFDDFVAANDPIFGQGTDASVIDDSAITGNRVGRRHGRLGCGHRHAQRLGRGRSQQPIRRRARALDADPGRAGNSRAFVSRTPEGPTGLSRDSRGKLILPGRFANADRLFFSPAEVIGSAVAVRRPNVLSRTSCRSAQEEHPPSS